MFPPEAVAKSSAPLLSSAPIVAQPPRMPLLSVLLVWEAPPESAVIPPAPIVSVLAPPMTTGALASGVKVRLLMLKSWPRVVLSKCPAPPKTKYTSSLLPGKPHSDRIALEDVLRRFRHSRGLHGKVLSG